MIIGLMIIFFVLGIVFFFIGDSTYEDKYFVAMCISFAIAGCIFVYGCFNGFTYYPPTEGTHQGIITAVDLEGKYFRRYEVYLKSSGYTNQGDETVYKIYDYEKELAEQLKECIGKKVKLYYGHDGGYINWKSCGTYHIKKVELLEGE